MYEWLKVERFVNGSFTSNTYVVAHQKEKNIWLIDPGDVSPIWDWMNQNKKTKIEGVLLTHGHFDHLYGINKVLEEYPQCSIYVANEYGKSLLFDARKNNSYYAPIEDVVVSSAADVRLYDNSLALWPDVTLKVLFTPGHSEDSVCLQVDNLLFTGDTLIHNLRTVTKLRGGDTLKLKDSIEILRTLLGQGLHVCPGHNEEFELDGYDLRKAINAKAPVKDL